MSQEGQIHQVHLKGHNGPVLSLAHSSTSIDTRKLLKQQRNTSADASSSQQQQEQQVPPCCLLSGSEDATARLWDLRYSYSRAALCIMSPFEDEVGEDRGVTAVGFHPFLGDDTSMTSGAYPFTVYTAVGANVYGYDLRKISSPTMVIQPNDERIHLPSLSGGDEINQIVFSDNHNNNSQNPNKVQMAIGDDDGFIRLTTPLATHPTTTNETLNSTNGGSSSSNNNNKSREIKHDKTNETTFATLVTSVSYRPRGYDLASAGTDCIINLWDTSRPRRPSSSFHIQVDESESNPNQVCNPPIVHQLSWSPSGRYLAGALGDGTVMLLTLDGNNGGGSGRKKGGGGKKGRSGGGGGRTLTEAGRLRGGHDAAVASVLFPRFGGISSSSHFGAEDRLLVSGGNDGAIFLWDLGTQIIDGDGVADPANMFMGCDEIDNDTTVSDVNMEDAASTGMANLSLQSEVEDKRGKPKILFGIPHEKKPNWIVSSAASEPSLPSSLFVADTSNDITAYILPRR